MSSTYTVMVASYGGAVTFLDTGDGDTPARARFATSIGEFCVRQETAEIHRRVRSLGKRCRMRRWKIQFRNSVGCTRMDRG
ncbi:hypothetical protein PT2222_300037 [Paraburkholderia tropica]